MGELGERNERKRGSGPTSRPDASRRVFVVLNYTRPQPIKSHARHTLRRPHAHFWPRHDTHIINLPLFLCSCAALLVLLSHYVMPVAVWPSAVSRLGPTEAVGLTACLSTWPTVLVAPPAASRAASRPFRRPNPSARNGPVQIDPVDCRPHDAYLNRLHHSTSPP